MPERLDGKKQYTNGLQIGFEITGDSFVIPKKQLSQKKVEAPTQYYQGGETTINTTCSRCSSKLTQSVRIVKNVGEKIQIIVEESCPHHGLFRNYHRIVRKTQLIKQSYP